MALIRAKNLFILLYRLLALRYNLKANPADKFAVLWGISLSAALRFCGYFRELVFPF